MPPVNLALVATLEQPRNKPPDTDQRIADLVRDAVGDFYQVRVVVLSGGGLPVCLDMTGLARVLDADNDRLFSRKGLGVRLYLKEGHEPGAVPVHKHDLAVEGLVFPRQIEQVGIVAGKVFGR